MCSLRIDLATTILDDDMNVYLVRPGARYGLFRTVLDHNALPADAPFLEVPDGVGITDSTVELNAQLERARQMRAWAKKSPRNRGQRPTADLNSSSYRLGVEQSAGVRTRIRNAANMILWEIPDNSLIVIPGSSLTGDAIMSIVGERTAARQMVPGYGHYRGLEFPGRPLTDVRTTPMLGLPSAVIGMARTSILNAKIVGHAEDRVLRIHFGDYQRRNDYVTSAIARQDDFDARLLGQMIDTHMAIENSIRTGRGIAPGRSLYEGSDYSAPKLHARVDSPFGQVFLESSRANTLALKLLMILAASPIPNGAIAQGIEHGQISVVNSRGAIEADDPVVVEASKEALVNFVNISGHDNVVSYLNALQSGIELNNAQIAGNVEDDSTMGD